MCVCVSSNARRNIVCDAVFILLCFFFPFSRSSLDSWHCWILFPFLFALVHLPTLSFSFPIAMIRFFVACMHTQVYIEYEYIDADARSHSHPHHHNGFSAKHINQIEFMFFHTLFELVWFIKFTFTCGFFP